MADGRRPGPPGDSGRGAGPRRPVMAPTARGTRRADRPSVRLPRPAGAVRQAAKEAMWLPRLAPHLPLAGPLSVGVGEPGFGCPWRWAVSRRSDGEALADSFGVAVALAELLTALRRVAPDGLSAEDTREDLGNGPLADRDRATPACLSSASLRCMRRTPASGNSVALPERRWQGLGPCLPSPRTTEPSLRTTCSETGLPWSACPGDRCRPPPTWATSVGFPPIGS
ncbi:phosphotransferase [Streptomyces sp. NPDC001795]|uniref:phosphotransferase n=1 Tax=unclassified Streptomyces TaxID=2593676 RepID=UPI0033323AA0